MLPFALLLFLFSTWTFIGYTLLSLLWSRRNLLQNLLLAPSVGVGLIVVLVFWLNRAGLPVSRFGPALFLSLLVAAGLAHQRLRVPIPWRPYLPFAGIFLLTALLTGGPMFEFGFNWLAYCNDDMANYVLAGHRFVENSYFEALPLRDLLTNRDLSAYYWEVHVAEGIRSGSDLLLAFVISWSRLTGHQVFMPVILALNLALVSATGALVMRSRKFRTAAMAVCLLVGLSAMNSLGTLLQLIGQVFGLMMLTSCATLFLKPPPTGNLLKRVQISLLPALQFAATLIVYPEVLPFFILSCGIYFGLRLLRRRQAITPAFAHFTVIGLFTSVFLNNYLQNAYSFLLQQMRAASGNFTGTGNFILFPFFLLPSGLAQLWGFFPAFKLIDEPMLTVAIVAGGILLVLSVIAVILQTWRGQPAAAVALAMLIGALNLARHQADYGLFKIAMFAQPFVLSTIVCAWLRWNGEVLPEHTNI